jgi:hypothetical protein
MLKFTNEIEPFEKKNAVIYLGDEAEGLSCITIKSDINNW